MKKTVIVLSGAIAYLVLSFVLSSYGNKASHRGINATIIDVFSSRFADIQDEKDKFYNYRFMFESTVGLSGEYVRLGGIKSITNGVDRLNVKDWVIHGGYSADEPELPASFRHFYDPTEAPGERYLKDLLNSFYAGWGVLNPQIDHVEWGISHPDHEYNYEAGKKAIEDAILEPDEDARGEYMAFAWRALGETLHLIADMGIACHVRDDAHPALLGQYIDIMGGPDPYEEICEALVKADGINSLASGQIDPEVRSFAKNSKKAETIAKQLAEYTNANFFSNHTIAGNDVDPIAHPEKKYDSPTIEQCDYDASTSLFVRNVGGNTVKMCKDLSYLNVLNGFRGYPYIDKECTISQANALIPQIVESGVNVIRCFIPDIEVSINNLTTDSIMGEVKHFTDQEYAKELKYNGWVTIRESKLGEEIGKVKCEDGIFEDVIDLSDFDRIEEKLYAEIEFGYVYVKSELYEEPLFQTVKVDLEQIDNGGIIKLTGNSWKFSAIHLSLGYSEDPLKWEGKTFSADNVADLHGATLRANGYGELSSDMTLLKDLYLTTNVGDTDGYWIDFKDVPMQVYKDSLVSLIPDRQAQGFIELLRVESLSNEGVQRVIEKVFWNNMSVKITFLKGESAEPVSNENLVISYSE